MIEWFESMAGPAYAPALMWTAIALLALFLILVAVKVFGRLSAGTFIAGGRNRRARLAVLDATAIDGQRRLVLVRRDDVEHLILIGGANDLVVERDIRAFAEEHHGDTDHEHQEPLTRQERPLAEPRPGQEPRMAAPMQQPSAPGPRPAAPSRPAPNSAAAPQPIAAPPVGAAPRPTPAPVPIQREPRFDQASDAPVRQAPRPSSEPLPEPAASMSASAPASPPVRTEPAVARPASVDAPAKGNVSLGSRARQDADLDDALLHELELTLEEDDRRSSAAPAPGPTRREPHLDDEMDRLLGELSSDRR